MPSKAGRQAGLLKTHAEREKRKTKAGKKERRKEVLTNVFLPCKLSINTFCSVLKVTTQHLGAQSVLIGKRQNVF